MIGGLHIEMVMLSVSGLMTGPQLRKQGKNTLAAIFPLEVF